MRCIIAGSRRFPNYNLLKYKDWEKEELRAPIYEILKESILKSGFKITAVVSGRCWGMDQLGEGWADENGIEKLMHPADWDKYHKAAGPIRNKQMSLVGDCLICLYTEGSKGSTNMINLMKKLGKPVFARIL